MSPAATLVAYAAGVVLVFGAAVGLGRAVGPVGGVAEHTAGAQAHGGEHGEEAEHDDGRAPAADGTTAGLPRGLAVAQDGYALQLARTAQQPGTAGRLELAITGPDGERVTDYALQHGKELHLIVVRRDLTGFQHLHPARDGQGRWSVPLTLAQPGPYKVFADFTPAGRDEPLTLAAELTAPGAYTPAPATQATTASAAGYVVTSAGELVAGTSSRLTLTVTKDGRPVGDLQPYLGAYGHLVALREGDLAYLHVHPDGTARAAGPALAFYADVPSAGKYRLFLDFQHEGVVRTAALTATAQAGAA